MKLALVVATLVCMMMAGCTKESETALGEPFMVQFTTAHRAALSGSPSVPVPPEGAPAARSYIALEDQGPIEYEDAGTAMTLRTRLISAESNPAGQEVERGPCPDLETCSMPNPPEEHHYNHNSEERQFFPLGEDGTVTIWFTQPMQVRIGLYGPTPPQVISSDGEQGDCEREVTNFLLEDPKTESVGAQILTLNASGQVRIGYGYYCNNWRD